MTDLNMHRLRQELTNHGSGSLGKTSGEILKRFDEIVAQLKARVDRIDTRIRIAVIVMTIYSILSVGLTFITG